LLGKEPEAALATFIFVLIPNSYWFQIVGGGLTRAWGELFFLLTLYCVYRMYHENTPVWIFFAILSGSLVVLSHLEWALQAATASFIFFIFWGRNSRGAHHTIAVIAGVLLLTSPWWATVMLRHGIDIFLRASQVTYPPWEFFVPLFSLSFTHETIPVIAVLAITGIFVHLAQKDYLPVTWILLSLLVDPRGGPSASVFPASILAMTVVSTGIGPQLLKTHPGSSSSQSWVNSFRTKIGRLFWGFFVILLIVNTFNFSFTFSGNFLGLEELNSLQWIKSNSSSTAKFLVIDWQDTWAHSSLLEWFPALTGRRSITTIQGSEWLTGDDSFVQQGNRYRISRACLYDDADCLNTFTNDPAGKFDYVVLSLKVPWAESRQSSLYVSLQNSIEYQMVYSSPEIKIFRDSK
jgi:hypothetical protein